MCYTRCYVNEHVVNVKSLLDVTHAKHYDFHEVALAIVAVATKEHPILNALPHGDPDAAPAEPPIPHDQSLFYT